MQLISDIIKELVDPDKSLTGPFLKTKILASKVKNSKLLEWINQELNGYTDSGKVPDYRKSGCRLVGSWVNEIGYGKHWKGTELDLPISGYGKEWDKYFSEILFTESIAGLEAFNNSDKRAEITQSLSADIAEIIANTIRRNGNPGYSIIKASKRVSANRIKDILSIIRNRLLDFMLKIDEEYGFVTDINKLSEQKNINEKIATIMSQTIIHNTGDGNVVNTGANSKVNVSTNITKNDFASLKSYLAQNGVSDSDIDDLKSVIDTEQPDSAKKTFGPKVNAWIKKMLGKAVDTSWKIGIGAAGKLLADGIQNYYGI